MRFQKLEVWKEAIAFSTKIYTLTSTFPNSEKFGLSSQLRKASTSISLNIAEGSGRSSDKEFARFLDISIGSLLECVSALHISQNLNYIDSKEFRKYYQQAETLCKRLYTFKKYLKGSRRPWTTDH